MPRGGWPIRSVPHRPEGAAQVVEARLDDGQLAGDRGRANHRRRQFGHDIAHQDLHLPNRPHLSEELGRDIRHLVRFIQDHRFRAGQQIAEALILEREIGEQQVVIDDDDLGACAARRASNTWQRENCGTPAQAVLAGRRNHGPHRRLFGQVGEFGEIADGVVAAQRETRSSICATPRSPPSSEPCCSVSSRRCRHR